MNARVKTRCAVLAIMLGLACGACSREMKSPAAQQPSPSGKEAKATSDVWKSETTGKEYLVRIDGDHFYAQWVNPPPVAAQRGAYIHTVCQRQGSKWVGTSRIYMPCTVGEGKSEHVVDTCHLTLKIEIDSITKDRITGRGQSLKKFDCASCKVIEAGWADFKWAPKR